MRCCPRKRDLMEKSFGLTVDEAAEKIFEQLVLLINIMICLGIVNGSDSLEAIVGWRFNIEFRIGVYLLPEMHDLLITKMQMAFGFDLDGRIFWIFWPKLRLSNDCLLWRGILLGGGFLWDHGPLLIFEHLLLHVVVDPLGSRICLCDVNISWKINKSIDLFGEVIEEDME